MSASSTIQQLEWPRFLEYASAFARSRLAKTLIHGLEDPSNWAPNLSAAKLRQDETDKVFRLLPQNSLWECLDNLGDPSPTLERLTLGAVLDLPELVLLKKWLHAMETWDQIEEDSRLFARFAADDSKHPSVRRLLQKWLTPDGELSENASPQLASLYQEIRSLKREISQVLDALIKRYDQKGILQETFSDVRDGRFVIPLKISAQNEVDGVIHETSVSRQTVFVEPPEVALLNQRLKKKQSDLEQEVYALLSEASRALEPTTQEIASAIGLLAHWDAVHARAKISEKYRGYRIEVTDRREFSLEYSAHPLLWFADPPLPQIIQNTLSFGENHRALLLTGPNTGGKTVLLKALGFAAICARTGFLFPSRPAVHPVVPFVDRVFADLGDPQSIERHLSSFSGHVLRFKEILESLTDRSLVLMDELNSATDPAEGAALGRAFLEALMDRHALVVATTHDPNLKALAIEDSRILNASMEFDESSQSPTYKITLGVPGRSRALETAERIGLPAPVIAAARKHLSAQHQRLEDLLAKLEGDAHGTRHAREQAEALRTEAERLERQWRQRTDELAHDWITQAKQKLRKTLEQAQEKIRSAAVKLSESETQSRKQIHDARSAVHQAFSEASEELLRVTGHESGVRIELPESKTNFVPLDPGSSVRIFKWKTTGTVIELNGDQVKVSAGALQAWFSRTEVEPIVGKKKPAAARIIHAAPVPNSQIDLRGMRLDEAMSTLGSYLDQAYRSQALKLVTIVHGVGTGAVREGARKLIASLPYVHNYRDGGAGAGGAGATVVEFDL